MGTTTKVVDREYLRSQFKNFNDILVKPKIQDLEDRKVDKVAGKGLSSNDFTDALKTKLEGLSNYDDTALVNAINTLNGDINTSGSVAKTTADAVAAIVAGADASFDTLKEISDWISSHADSAAAMNSQITDNTNAIALLNGNESTEGSVAHSIKQAFDALAYEIEDTDIDFENLDKIIISGDNTVRANESITLTSNVSGVTWSVSNGGTGMATVNQSGVVTGIVSGEVTIVAAKSGYTSGTKTITIQNAIASVSNNDLQVNMADSPISMDTISNGIHSWESSDESVVSIDENNNMIINGVGTATLTPTTLDSGYDRPEDMGSLIINVTVEE